MCCFSSRCGCRGRCSRPRPCGYDRRQTCGQGGDCSDCGRESFGGGEETGWYDDADSGCGCDRT